jgi:hypothetical protein
MTKRRVGVVVGVVVVLLVAGTAVVAAGRRGHGPAYRLLCPEKVRTYAVMPTPDVRLARGSLTVGVGERFAVGGYRGTLPAAGPLLTGDATVVRTAGTKVFPTGERCGRVVSGYRYTIFLAVHPGEVTIDDAAVHVTA